MRKVMKFGCSSLKDFESINRVTEVIIEERNKGFELVVVVSARGKTTDDIISTAKEFSLNPSRRELDLLLSTGEMISSGLLAINLIERGHDAISLTGFQAGFQTEGLHTRNRILEIDSSRIERHLEENKIVVIAGYQGMNSLGDITTLGRGGSDTSAVAIASRLSCPCEIFTDVDGIYSVDPRIYKNSRKIQELSYDEALEMAGLGAGVIDPRAVELAKLSDVEIKILLNTNKISGTVIKSRGRKMEKNSIINISLLDDILQVNFVTTLDEIRKANLVFTDLAREAVNIDVINQINGDGEVSFSFTSTMDRLYDIADIFKKNRVEVEFITGVSKVSVIGNSMREQTGVVSRIFELFADNNIRFYQVSSSEISISYIVDSNISNDVVVKLAEEFKL